jgi:hypothetical protein
VSGLVKNLMLLSGSTTLQGGFWLSPYMGVITDRGVRQVFTPVMWKIEVPPRIHIFLWLLANNKVLTRDNLAKRKDLDDLTCLFCAEPESVQHLFFGCCVAQSIWETISEIIGITVGRDFESVAKLWIRDKNCKFVNIVNAAVLWALWKTRNNLCFQDSRWPGTRRILGTCA